MGVFREGASSLGSLAETSISVGVAEVWSGTSGTCLTWPLTFDGLNGSRSIG